MTQGRLHRHEDGTEHHHFAQGFTIGKQVIADHDGSEPHGHGTMSLGGGVSNPNKSGPVVWIEHTRDEHCTVNLEGVCLECGVFGDEPCPDCGGLRFHADECDSVSA